MINLRTLVEQSELTPHEAQSALRIWAKLENDSKFGDIGTFDTFLSQERVKKTVRALFEAMGPVFAELEECSSYSYLATCREEIYALQTEIGEPL